MRTWCLPLFLLTISQITTLVRLTNNSNRLYIKVPFSKTRNNSNLVVCSDHRCTRIAIHTSNNNSFQFTDQIGFRMASSVNNLTMIISVRPTLDQATRFTSKQVFFQIYEAPAIICSKVSPNHHFWRPLLCTTHFSDKIRLIDCLKSEFFKILNFKVLINIKRYMVYVFDMTFHSIRPMQN